MADMERWRIVEQFTIYQIALLIAGYDPADAANVPFEIWNKNVRSDTIPMLTALQHAIEDKMLPLHKAAYYGATEANEIDFQSSLVHVSELRKWLAGKEMQDCFFFVPAIADEAGGIEDASGHYYAPKLAAANAAWKAVTSEPLRLRGKSPKQALTHWLTEHAEKFGLVNKDGSPNITGIEEVAKAANWQLAGGAPTTPKVDAEPDIPLALTGGRVQSNQGKVFSIIKRDDDIPF